MPEQNLIDIADYFLEHKKWQDFRDETWSKLFDALKKFGANQQNLKLFKYY